MRYTTTSILERFNNIYDTLYRLIAMGHRHSIQSFIYFTGMAEGDAVNLFTSQNLILFHSCSNRCPPLIISFSCHFDPIFKFLYFFPFQRSVSCIFCVTNQNFQSYLQIRIYNPDHDSYLQILIYAYRHFLIMST